MKKLILTLVVVALMAPASVQAITFVATDNLDGTCTVTFNAGLDPNVPPVAMGLDIDVDGTDPCHLITKVDGIDSFFDIYMDYAHDMEADPCTPGYSYGVGNPIAKIAQAGKADLPLHDFCISMGGLGGPAKPLANPNMAGTAFVLHAENLDDPCDPVTGTISINALRGGVIGSDTEPMDTNLSIPFTINYSITDCVKDTAPFYAEWVGEGKNWAKPDCWCYERNCRGDADGVKTGTAYVNTPDLSIFVDAFGKADFKMDQTKICADFDHIKTGTARVNTPDLSIFVAYFGKADFKCPPCPLDWDGDTDDDYNFWTVP